MAGIISAVFHIRDKMRVISLSINGFRNLTTIRADFSTGVNIFYGANASGKTNLLEALFTLCLGRSQRGVPDSILLNWNCDVYRLEGLVETKGRQYRLAVAFQRGGRKKLTLDSVQTGLAELYSHFTAVSAGPEDGEILAGPPSVRRAFLDIYLSQYTPNYLTILTQYQRALSQKNAALRREMDPSPFEPQLITFGAKVMHARQGFLSTLGEIASRYHYDISSGEQLVLMYRPTLPHMKVETSVEGFETLLQQRISEYGDRERAVQMTLVGPHRDEIVFEVGGYPARTHGSRGQCRTAAISLKLAIYHMLREKRGMPPLLLLDEVFAELDENRTAALVDAFSGFSQLFMTTATLPPAQLKELGHCYRVVGGHIEDLA